MRGGRLSYALYLWHPLCLGLGGRVANHAAYIALSLLFALGSAFVVERPFLALKVKFSRV